MNTHDTANDDADIVVPDQIPALEEKKYLKTWEIAVASFVGGSLMMLADVLYSPSPVTTKIAGWVGNRVLAGLDSVWFEFVAFCVLILLGLGLCFVNRPRNRLGAFAQGSSVIGVLVAINIGAQAVGVATAQTITLEGSVDIAVQKPRAYGPLGVGTLVTGRSTAQTLAVEIGRPLALECASELSIGNDIYCAVKAGQLPEQTRILFPDGTEQIWIRK